MGFALMVGDCYLCWEPFSFNPMKVPSIRDKDGVRQAICGACVERLNCLREKKGLEPFSINREAYEPCREEELT